MRKARVLITTPDLSLPGGVAEYLKTLSLDQENNIDFFCIHDPKQKNIFSRLAQKYLAFFSKTRQYDVINIHASFRAKSFFRDMGFIILAKVLKKKVIVTMHGWENSFEKHVKRSWILRNLFRMSYGRVDAYMLLGDIFKQKLKALGVRTDRFFLGTTVAEDRYIDKFDMIERCKSKETFSILFLSRIEKEKGVYIAIDAFSKMKSSMPSELVIAGDGTDLEKAKDYVRKKAIAHIKFVGFVSGEAKHELLTNSDMLFFPTFYGEGLPTVILEAMLYGLPVVSRSNAAIPDIIEHEVNGLLCDSLNADDFTPLIERIIADRELYCAMAKANHHKAIMNFTKDKVRAKVLAVYEQFAID